jgi:hypothetical protein
VLDQFAWLSPRRTLDNRAKGFRRLEQALPPPVEIDADASDLLPKCWSEPFEIFRNRKITVIKGYWLVGATGIEPVTPTMST